jgi:hypothetical protein
LLSSYLRSYSRDLTPVINLTRPHLIEQQLFMALIDVRINKRHNNLQSLLHII